MRSAGHPVPAEIQSCSGDQVVGYVILLSHRGQIDLFASAEPFLRFVLTAGPGLKIPVKTNANLPQPMAATAGNRDHIRSQRGITFQKVFFQLGGTDQKRGVRLAVAFRNIDLLEKCSGDIVVTFRSETAAGSVFLPLVNDQRPARHNIQHLLNCLIGNPAIVDATELRPSAIVLGPQTMQHKCIGSRSLTLQTMSTGILCRAKCWRPGNDQSKIVKFASLPP